MEADEVIFIRQAPNIKTLSEPVAVKHFLYSF